MPLPVLKILHLFVQRLILASRTLPTGEDWLVAIAILVLFALIYLPIGFSLGFLRVQPEAWQTILRVTISAFFMPGLLEESVFRALLLPHPTESPSPKTIGVAAGIGWVLFMVYHVHPLTPVFFKELPFLLGAGLLGAGCTVSYLQSGSLWPPVVIHWLSVVVWLILLGGLKKFEV